MWHLEKKYKIMVFSIIGGLRARTIPWFFRPFLKVSTCQNSTTSEHFQKWLKNQGIILALSPPIINLPVNCLYVNLKIINRLHPITCLDFPYIIFYTLSEVLTSRICFNNQELLHFVIIISFMLMTSMPDSVVIL